MAIWNDVDYDSNCVNQHGCEATSCASGQGDIVRWCHVVEYPCNPGSYEVHSADPDYMTCGDDTPTESIFC